MLGHAGERATHRQSELQSARDNWQITPQSKKDNGSSSKKHNLKSTEDSARKENHIQQLGPSHGERGVGFLVPVER